MEHFGLRYLQVDKQALNHSCRLEGFVLWCCELSGGRTVGVRWDWIEVQRGVLAIENPLEIRTNASLVDGSGEAVPARSALLKLNLLVYLLDWQNRVLREIETIGLRALASC